MILSARSRLWADVAAGVLAIAAPVAVTVGSAHAGNPGEDYNPATGLGVPDLTRLAKT